MRRKKYGCMGILMAAALMTAGCSSTGQQPLGQVMLEAEEETEYSLATAEVEDVQNTQDVNCVYQQVDQQEVSFAVGGRKVQQVYVQEGDTVETGTLLAQLDPGTLDSDICTQTYNVQKNELLIKQAQESKDAQIAEMKKQMEAASNMGGQGMDGQGMGPQEILPQTQDQTPDNSQNDPNGQSGQNKELEEAIAGIEKSCRYQVEDYQDAKDIAQMRLDELKQEKEQCCIYAGMSGTVSFVKENLVTSMAQEGETVVKIIDGANCTFCSDQVDLAGYFTDGDDVTMTLTTGGDGSYAVVPYQMENWKDQMQLTLTNSADSQGIAVGAQAKITIVLEEKQDALCVPQNAVHSAQEGTKGKEFYVYKVDENNIRQVQWVETGIQSKDKIEITKGLEEGDKVIVR